MTRIRRRRASRPSASSNERTAALDAPYAAIPGRFCSAITPEMLTMTPPSSSTPSAACAKKDRNEGVGHEEFLHGVDRQLVDRTERHDADSVDHHVQSACVLDGGAHRSVARVRIAEVQRNAVAGHVEGGQPVVTARDQGERCPTLDEVSGDC